MWFNHRGTVLGVNLDLVKEQRITFEALCGIVQLHKERYDLKNFMGRTTNKRLIKILYKQLTDIEFELQTLWGFELNQIRHMSFLWPHCTCPKMDNRDAFPHVQYYSSNCILHEDYVKEKINQDVTFKDL
jgi:hypothetical protein